MLEVGSGAHAAVSFCMLVRTTILGNVREGTSCTCSSLAGLFFISISFPLSVPVLEGPLNIV